MKKDSAVMQSKIHTIQNAGRFRSTNENTSVDTGSPRTQVSGNVPVTSFKDVALQQDRVLRRCMRNRIPRITSGSSKRVYPGGYRTEHLRRSCSLVLYTPFFFVSQKRETTVISEKQETKKQRNREKKERARESSHCFGTRGALVHHLTARMTAPAAVFAAPYDSLETLVSTSTYPTSASNLCPNPPLPSPAASSFFLLG